MKNVKNCGSAHVGTGAIYGTGVIGGVIYFLQNAETITEAFFGIIFAFFWPGVLVYKALEILKI